jgi:hypothetical protein
VPGAVRQHPGPTPNQEAQHERRIRHLPPRRVRRTQPRAKHGFQNGRQRYKRYCSHHYGKLHDSTQAERRKRNPHRLTHEERRKARLRMDACERCGWNEARCDVHRIIPGGPYTEGNTITLCPNCHRVETEKARLQDGFGGRGF